MYFHVYSKIGPFKIAPKHFALKYRILIGISSNTNYQRALINIIDSFKAITNLPYICFNCSLPQINPTRGMRYFLEQLKHTYVVCLLKIYILCKISVTIYVHTNLYCCYQFAVRLLLSLSPVICEM